MPGPPPKPTKLRLLEGNPGKRPINQTEPRPAAGAPSCPTWLDREGKAEWRRIVRALDRIGLLCKIDRAAIAAYCQAWAEFHIATRQLQNEGRTFKTESGYLAPHPAVAMQRSAWQAIKSYAALFGLDPASRSKLSAPGEADLSDDPLEIWQRGQNEA